MDAPKLIETALQSPVLVAIIPAIVAIVGGRWIIQAKDAQLKVKDEQIAALERWMPANLVEQLEASKKVFQLRLDDANATIEILTNQNLSEQREDERWEGIVTRLHEVVNHYEKLVNQLNEQLDAAQRIRSTTMAGIYSGRVSTYPLNLSPFIEHGPTFMSSLGLTQLVRRGVVQQSPESAADQESEDTEPTP